MGARLGQAGHKVSFLARGANLQALRDKGLHLRTPAGEFDTGPQTASDDPASLGVADVVLITTKLYDLEQVARRANLAAAVNRRYARFDAPLRDGDELAFVPPVSGG